MTSSKYDVSDESEYAAQLSYDEREASDDASLSSDEQVHGITKSRRCASRSR